MTIHLNGSANPLSVTYNGTELDIVYATIGGVSSVFPVWERASAFPETISNVVSVRQANGETAYFRNMRLVAEQVDQYGNHRGRYEGDVTIEVSWSNGVMVGASAAEREPTNWRVYTSAITSVTGVPSGYTYYYGATEDDSSHTVAFDVYKNSQGVLDPSSKVAMNLQTYCSIDKDGLVTVTTYLPGHNWPVMTRNTGKIFQQAGTLILMKN